MFAVRAYAPLTASPWTGLGAVEVFVRATDADAARDLIAKAERGELVLPEIGPDTKSNP